MSKYRVWYDGDPEHTNFDSLAQALKYVRKTKALDESNSGLEECIDGYWDEWMDSDDQEIHDHLYMYGGKSPYLNKVSVEKDEPIRPSIMDTVSFSREELVASLEEEDDDDDEENEEDAYDEIIDPDEEVLDEEDLDERLMNVIGVSPKTTTDTSATKDEDEDEEFIGEEEIYEFDDEDEDDLDDEEEEDEK